MNAQIRLHCHDRQRFYGGSPTFARHCHCSHELAAIECGAKAYMEQLPPMLELLRGLTVV